MTADEQAEIMEQFGNSAKEHFGENLSFTIATGSFAYLGAVKSRSDLDVMNVLDDRVYNLDHIEVFEMIKGFAEKYMNLHRKYDYEPDRIFPGEYITNANANDAIAGRGFHSNNQGLYLPADSSDQYFLEDPERYFRAWRSMLAFSKVLAGNSNQAYDVKLDSWETIISYLISSSGKQTIDANTVIDLAIGDELGVSDHYETFREDELIHVKRSLVRLHARNLISGQSSGYSINMENMEAWKETVLQGIVEPQEKKSSFLLDQEDEKALTDTVG